MRFIEWFLLETIYGYALIVGAFGLLMFGIHRVMPKFRWAVPAGIFALLVLLTLPSYPRFKFEWKTNQDVAARPEFKVINATGWGDLTKPLTWFHAPKGSYWIAAPDPMNRIEGMTSFRSVFMRFEEEPLVAMHDVDCDDNEIHTSRPDDKGVMRYSKPQPDKMSPDERKAFCELDWTAETKAFWETAQHQLKAK
jgi:hypothetical protein